jgi:hypothetical protein
MPLSNKQFIDEFDRLLTKYEMKYVKKVKKEIKRALKEIENTLIKDSNLAFDGTLQTEHAIQLKLFQDEASREALGVFIALQANQWAFEPPVRTVDNIISSYTNRYTLELSNLKANTTFKMVKDRISKELIDGTITPQFIGKKIREVINLTPSRALMIARTEIHNASTYAQQEIAQDFQETYSVDLYKIWSAVKDKRTRTEHRVMGSHPPVKMNEFFNVGGTLMSRPGDPAGGAKQTVNCRCTLLYKTLDELKK